MKGKESRTRWAGMTWFLTMSLVLLVCTLCSNTAFAQLRNSTITGTVTDPSGAVVPKAAITITNQLTGEEVKSQSGPAGDYSVPYLAAGRYSVTVDAPGFQTFRVNDIAVELGVTVQVNAKLAVGATSQVVQVAAQTAELQTETSTVAGSVGTQIINSVPNINDNPVYYASLTAGVVPAPGMYSNENLGVGFQDRIQYSEMRVNGGELGMNDIQLDGVPVQDSGWHSVAVMPNPDALQEVKVDTNDLSADLGGGQAVMQMVTKSGTNDFHGDAFYKLRNEQLNANGQANDLQGIPRGKYRVDEAGGSVGGPVILPKLFNGKNKIFFFGSYDRLWNVTPANFLDSVPTTLERTGDYSQTMINGNSGPVVNELFDPYNVINEGSGLYQRQLIPGANVNNSAMGADTDGLKYLAAFGAPNRTPSDDYGDDNYFLQGTAPLRRNSFNSRMDFHFGKNSFYLSGGIQNGSWIGVNEWGQNSPWRNQSSANEQDDNPYYAIGDIITLNATTFIDLHAGYQRIGSISSYPTNGGFTAADYTAYGMPAAEQALIVISGVAPSVYNLSYQGDSYGASLNNTQWNWKNEHQNNYDFNASITKVIGKWTLKEGFDQRIMQGNWRDIEWMTPSLGAYVNECYCEQYYTYGGNADGSLNTNPLQSGNQKAQAALGVMGYRDDPGSGIIPALSFKWGSMYTQNDWKATNRLTLNLGLRYEIQPGPTERHNQLYSVNLYGDDPYASFDLVSGNNAPAASPDQNAQSALGIFAFPGTDGYSRNDWNTELSDFSPRLGAAYRLTDKTVIRGGYGRIYAPTNTGFNANGTVYGAGEWQGGYEMTPYGQTENGMPGGVAGAQTTDPAYGTVNSGRFQDQADSTALQAPFQGSFGSGQSPLIYGSENNNAGADYFIRTMKNTYVDQWNVFVEHRFGGWLASAGYVGSRTERIPWRLWPLSGTFQVPQTTLQPWRAAWVASNGTVDNSQAQVNNPMPALVGLASGPIGSGTISNLQSQEGYLGLLNTTVINDLGTAKYQSVEFSLNHSFSSGLTAQFNYTYGHATGISEGGDYATYAESQAVGGSEAGAGGFNYSNLPGNYGLQGYDTPNRFVGVVTYTSQFGTGGKMELGSSVARAIAGGWTLGTVVNIQSGLPWGVNCNTGQNYGPIDGKCIATGQNLLLPKSYQHWSGAHPGPITLPDGHVIETPSAYTMLKWNPDAFTNQIVQFPVSDCSNGATTPVYNQPCYSNDQYYYGQTPTYDTNLRLPRFANTNLNITRDIPVTERYKFQILGDFTNLFNRANFNPGAVSNGVSPFTSTSALPTGGTIGEDGSELGLSPSFLDPRQITLTAKFTF